MQTAHFVPGYLLLANKIVRNFNGGSDNRQFYGLYGSRFYQFRRYVPLRMLRKLKLTLERNTL
jgi:hypothetical protein